jgi:hypothetical protein
VKKEVRDYILDKVGLCINIGHFIFLDRNRIYKNGTHSMSVHEQQLNRAEISKILAITDCNALFSLKGVKEAIAEAERLE